MVRCGIDRIEEFAEVFQGKRLGMATSVSGVTMDLKPGYVEFHKRYPLICLFGPEHGIYGAAADGASVGDEVDPLTGVPVYSLYGSTEGKHIEPEILEKLDAVVYDIQDLGLRFYTFIATMIYILEDCAKAGKELIILDRPAPLGGAIVEGGLLRPEYKSFVGPYPLCQRYGLTMGELATMVNAERQLNCKLTVIPCEGWKRDQLYSETGNLWMMPSLAIPKFDTALAYAGNCLFEGTNVSEGRGTACPFEVIGAPYINAQTLAESLNSMGLEGVIFTAAYFTPSASKWKGEACEGVALHVTDQHKYRPVAVAMTMIYEIRRLWPDSFKWRNYEAVGGKRFTISLLTGCGTFEQEELPPLKDLLAQWEQESAEFARRKAAYHLYE